MSTPSKILLPLLLLTLSFSACKDDGEAPHIPEITYVSDDLVQDTVSGSVIPYFQFTFDFIDGDGNIGTYSAELPVGGCIGEPDIDMRVYGLVDGERLEFENDRNTQCIEDLTPQGQNKLLEGEVSIRGQYPPQLSEVGDSLLYTVQMQDRDGNKSNVIESPIQVVE